MYNIINMLYVFFSVLCGYLLGSINTSIVVTKIITGKDIRTMGSGNAGTTNALRTTGKKGGILTLVGDLLKVVVAISLTRGVGYLLKYDDAVIEIIVYFVAMATVIGHIFPVFHKFRGGKGVATSAMAILMIDPLVGAVIIAIVVVVIVVSRYVSLGSIIGGILFIVAAFVFHSDNILYLIFAITLGCLVIFMHRENIKRLINGTENKFGGDKH